MTQVIGEWNDYLWSSLEDALVPLPKGSNDSKIMHHLPAVPLFAGALVTGSLACVGNIASYAASFFTAQAKIDPRADFSAVCRDSRLWTQLGNLQSQVTLGQENARFLFGAATATFQDSGAVHCPNSQWADWEKKIVPEENQSGESANLFQLYQTPAGRKEVTDRLHKLGVNSYRFSLEWSQIQPDPMTFDLKVLKTYVDFCKFLRDQEIQPMVTLLHFSEPKWFHALGSFEKEENIGHFVDFAKRVFPALTQPYKGKPLVEYVCTINEPNIEAFSRYFLGSFSPGLHFRFEKAANFMKTALKAHTVVYENLKKMAPEVQIGIVHQRLSFDSTNPIIHPLSKYVGRLVNAFPMNFFQTGRFELKIPCICHIFEEWVKPKTDFVGLQYYVRPLEGLLRKPMTQMPFPEDPEGIYDAILEVHEAYQVPIIVTENGISTHDDAQRSRYVLRALYAAQRAQEVIGKENLIGYYLWSFCDNFEWDRGHDPQKFGAYALQKIDGKRVLAADPKPGMDSFIKVAQAWHAAHPAAAVA